MVRKVLSIIVATNRPLTLSEMNIAANIGYRSRSICNLDWEDEQDFKSRLGAWCGLFVSIHQDKIYFLHQTAREFLLSDLVPPSAISLDLRWHHSITARQAHTVLSECFVLYLNLFNSDPSLLADPMEESDHFVEKHAFLDYSAKTWGIHIREARILDGDEIIRFVIQICDTNSKSYSAWSRIYWATRETREAWESRIGWKVPWTKRVPDNLTDLMIASYFGHLSVVKLLLESGAKINHQDKNGWTATSWAAEQGHSAVVKVLHEAGGMVDCKYLVFYKEEHRPSRGDGRYALRHGRLTRHDSHELDEDSGVSLARYYINGERERTPLSRAAEEGHETLVKLLIETGKVDVNWRDQRTCRPLSWGVEGGHWAVVKLLLAAGAKVHYQYNVPYEAYKEYEATTPLSRAAERGHDAVVELLLETPKANIDWKDGKGWTSLSWAVEGGFEGVLKLLLRARAIVHYTYNVYGKEVLNYYRRENCAGASYGARLYLRTPLSRAAEKGYRAVVKLLIETGEARIDFQDSKGWIPLSWAVETGLRPKSL